MSTHVELRHSSAAPGASEIIVSCVARRVLEWYDEHGNTLTKLTIWDSNGCVYFQGEGRVPIVGHAYILETGLEESDLEKWLSGNFRVVGTLV